MAITPSTFREYRPEFSNTSLYPDASIQLWINAAEKMLPERVWGDLWDMGVGLFVAHQLALQARDAKVAAMGGAPGQVTGPTSSTSIDKVSISYSTGDVSLANAGFWGLTRYGLQLLQFARMLGAGGRQL